MLTYPAALGLMLSVGALMPLASGSVSLEHASDAAAGVAVVAGLVSGYYLLMRFLIKGRASTRGAISWWITATVVALVSASVAGLYWASNFSVIHGGTYFMPVGAGFGILGYGALFLPSFLHLSTEVWGRAV